MKKERIPMPVAEPSKRKREFDEVAHGYTIEMAKKEAERCLQCKNPICQEGCPVGVQIKDFIKHLSDDNLDKAYQVIQETNTLPAICGRVCPQEKQCEAKCILGKKGEPVAIGRLERFVGDKHLNADN